MLAVHGELTALSDPKNKKSAIVKTGKFGVLNGDQILWMVLNKVGVKNGSRPAYESSIRTATNKMLSESGTATPFKYDGLTIYHGSSGVGPQTGCTLFYVARGGGVAKLVGIGYHVGAQTYQMDWVDGMWTQVGSKVTLDD